MVGYLSQDCHSNTDSAGWHFCGDLERRATMHRLSGMVAQARDELKRESGKGRKTHGMPNEFAEEYQPVLNVLLAPAGMRSRSEEREMEGRKGEREKGAWI